MHKCRKEYYYIKSSDSGYIVDSNLHSNIHVTLTLGTWFVTSKQREIVSNLIPLNGNFFGEVAKYLKLIVFLSKEGLLIYNGIPSLLSVILFLTFLYFLI